MCMRKSLTVVTVTKRKGRALSDVAQRPINCVTSCSHASPGKAKRPSAYKRATTASLLQHLPLHRTGLVRILGLSVHLISYSYSGTHSITIPMLNTHIETKGELILGLRQCTAHRNPYRPYYRWRASRTNSLRHTYPRQP